MSQQGEDINRVQVEPLSRMDGWPVHPGPLHHEKALHAGQGVVVAREPVLVCQQTASVSPEKDFFSLCVFILIRQYDIAFIE